MVLALVVEPNSKPVFEEELQPFEELIQFEPTKQYPLPKVTDEQ